MTIERCDCGKPKARDEDYQRDEDDPSLCWADHSAMEIIAFLRASLAAAEARAETAERMVGAMMDEALAWTADDRPLPEDEAIKAAHPTRTNRHDLYETAMRIVGAKRSKGALVDVVTWLLHERDARHAVVEAAWELRKYGAGGDRVHVLNAALDAVRGKP